MDILGLGLGPIPGSAPGGGLIAFPKEIYQTNILDLTVAKLGIELIPAKPGHIGFITSMSSVIEQVTGTQVTPATIRAGNNPARTNLSPLSSFPTNTNVNAANVPSFGGSGITPTVSPLQQFSNTPGMLDIVSGAIGTGGFTLRGRIYVVVLWMNSGV